MAERQSHGDWPADKVLVLLLQGPALGLHSHAQSQDLWCVPLISALRWQRQVGPWSTLASYFSLLAKFQASEKLSLKEKVVSA